MAQVGWIFLGTDGGRHRVGLYHGDRSGHLMIHCDLRVVQVDFNVQEPRDYSFFIEEELCEIRLQREAQGFSYEFIINKQADTPHNRILKQTASVNHRKTAILFGVGIFLVVGFFFGIHAYNRNLEAKRSAGRSINSQLDPAAEQILLKEGQTATARIFVVKDRIFYSFDTKTGQQINGFFAKPDSVLLLPTGFPLRDRDEFGVIYLPADPKSHRVYFDRPTDIQVQEYLRFAALAEQTNHPEKSVRACQCLAVLTKEEKGWPTLADILYQSATPEQNPAHNRDSYLRLIRDVGMAKKIRDICDLQ